MTSTGYICQQTGVYKCKEHPNVEIALSKGEKFPPCTRPGGAAHGTTWILVRKA